MVTHWPKLCQTETTDLYITLQQDNFKRQKTHNCFKLASYFCLEKHFYLKLIDKYTVLMENNYLNAFWNLAKDLFAFASFFRVL